jgi:hypothetical protein
MEGASVAVIDSYVSDFKEDGADTQALWANTSPGPLKIVNNYLEAAGENILFGGDYIQIENMIPSDIEIRRNYFFKPLSWMSLTWDVQNLLEFKNAQRVLVEGNLFENNWPANQSGFSVLITPRTSGGADMWCLTNDITIRFNTLKNLGSGFNVGGRDDGDPVLRTQRVLIQNNVINVTGLGGAEGRVFQVIGGMADLIIDHNTAFITSTYEWTALGSIDELPVTDRFTFSNNLASHGGVGFFGGGVGEGTAALTTFFTNWSFTKNAIIGPDVSSQYPTNNYFPTNATAVGFVNYLGGDYRLSANSPYKNAGTDGKDLGADIDAITNAGAVIGGPVVTLAPPTNLRIIQ